LSGNWRQFHLGVSIPVNSRYPQDCRQSKVEVLVSNWLQVGGTACKSFLFLIFPFTFPFYCTGSVKGVGWNASPCDFAILTTSPGLVFFGNVRGIFDCVILALELRLWGGKRLIIEVIVFFERCLAAFSFPPLILFWAFGEFVPPPKIPLEGLGVFSFGSFLISFLSFFCL